MSRKDILAAAALLVGAFAGVFLSLQLMQPTTAHAFEIESGGCSPQATCAAASFSTTGTSSASSYTATAAATTNLTCSANSSTFCVSTGSGRIGSGSSYVTFDGSAMNVASSISDGVHTTGIRNTSTHLRVSGLGADNASNANVRLFRNSGTADATTNKLGVTYGKSTSGADVTFGITSVHGGIQGVGIANASLPTCNGNGPATADGTYGRLYWDTTNNALVVCDGTNWKTLAYAP